MQEDHPKLPNFNYYPFYPNLEDSPREPTPPPNSSKEESFQPEYHQIKKMGLKPNKKKLRVGGWTSRENAIYLHFMRANVPDFETQKARRTTKVFFRLSKILKKRTPDQCRSHHQKLQMKHKDNLDAIMDEVQNKINKTIAEEYVSHQIRMQYSSGYMRKDLRPLPRTGASQKEQEMELNNIQPQIKVKDNIICFQIKTQTAISWRPF